MILGLVKKGGVGRGWRQVVVVDVVIIFILMIPQLRDGYKAFAKDFSAGISDSSNNVSSLESKNKKITYHEKL